MDLNWEIGTRCPWGKRFVGIEMIMTPEIATLVADALDAINPDDEHTEWRARQMALALRDTIERSKG